MNSKGDEKGGRTLIKVPEFWWEVSRWKLHIYLSSETFSRNPLRSIDYELIVYFCHCFLAPLFFVTHFFLIITAIHGHFKYLENIDTQNNKQIKTICNNAIQR